MGICCLHNGFHDEQSPIGPDCVAVLTGFTQL
jgi:hypothetical protein